MFNRHFKKIHQATKEARILLALAFSIMDNDLSKAKKYIKKAMCKLCEHDAENDENIQNTVEFLDRCLNDKDVKDIFGENVLSLARLITELKLKESPKDEELEGFFYSQQGDLDE